MAQKDLCVAIAMIRFPQLRFLGRGSQGTYLNIGYYNIISFCTLMSKVKIRPL
jgi:hypothetical protein